MKNIKLGDKLVGHDEPCFIIAEAGVNHNGELEKALQLIDIAADAKADSVKFQTFRAEQVVTESGEMAEYQKTNLGKVESQRDMLRKLELPEEWYPQLITRAKEKNIIFFSTPHGGKASVDFLESVGVPFYKVGSGDLTNYILLERIAKTGKPVIMSSGMATLDEVKDAIKFIRSKGQKDIVMLHCTTNYPCPPNEVNLKALSLYMEELDVLAGYSDHTEHVETAIAARALGMVVYERHYTIDKNLTGPDHVASDSPEEFKSKVASIRLTETLLGKKEKNPTASEIRIAPVARRSIVLARDQEAGHVLTADDLEAKRPGDGKSPKDFEKLIGKILKTDLKADQQIKIEDVE